MLKDSGFKQTASHIQTRFPGAKAPAFVSEFMAGEMSSVISQ